MRAKERVKENKGTSKGKSKGAKGSHKAKTSKKSETRSGTQESGHVCTTVQMGQVCTTDTSWIHEEWRPDEWNDGWSLDEWNGEWNCVAWREDCEQTHVSSVSSFSPEWVKTKLDTGAAVITFPSIFGPEGIGDGSFYDWIPDGEAWQFQGYDEKWFAQISEWKTHGCTPERCAALHQHKRQELRRSRTKNNKTSM